MSKRNNSKQEITENEVHAMAEEWQNSKDDERVLVLFSLSEFGRLRFYVREETKERAPRPSWWKRALDWFFPFNIKK